MISLGLLVEGVCLSGKICGGVGGIIHPSEVVWTELLYLHGQEADWCQAAGFAHSSSSDETQEGWSRHSDVESHRL